MCSAWLFYTLTSSLNGALPHRGTRGHKYKLYKKFPRTRIRSEFVSEFVITVWTELSVSTDFSTITRFKDGILNADLSDYLVCF